MKSGIRPTAKSGTRLKLEPAKGIEPPTYALRIPPRLPAGIPALTGKISKITCGQEVRSAEKPSTIFIISSKKVLITTYNPQDGGTTLEEAVSAARAELVAMRRAGSDPRGAREIVMETYLLLPTEEEVPDDELP